MLYPIITRGLQTVGLPILQKAANSVGNLVGKVVKPSVSSILTAIKNWAGNNPGKILVATNLLAAVGIDIAVDEISDALGDKAGNPQMVQLLNEISRNLDVERQSIVGDRESGTTHGVPTGEFLEQAEHFDEIYAVVQRGVQAIGSFNALMHLRKAIMLEDADFEMYRNRRKAMRAY